MAVFPASGATGAKAQWSADGTTYVDIPHVREWTLTDEPEAKEYRSSSTNGAKRRLPGGGEFSGMVNIYVDASSRYNVGSLNITSGDVGYFKLFESTGDFWIAPAYVESIETGAQIENEDLIEASINFSSDGNLTYPT